MELLVKHLLLIVSIIILSVFSVYLFIHKQHVSPKFDQAKSYPYQDYYHRIVSEIVELHTVANQNRPENLKQQNAKLTGNEFDVMQYFSAFKHLKVREGFVLDYVYYNYGGGGNPVFYVRSNADPKFLSTIEYGEYLKKKQRPNENKKDWELILDNKDYLQYFQTDDTPQGFFDLSVFYIIGGQFYLYWHSNYNDTQIILSQQDILNIPVNRIGKILPKALKINLEPVIIMENEKVTVSLVTFSNWAGFSKEPFVFERSYPHKLLEKTRKILLKYSCGIVF
jgi:hypothetical protein